MTRASGRRLLARFRRDLGLFRALTWRERGLLVESALLVPLIALWMRPLGFRRLRSILTRAAPLPVSEGRDGPGTGEDGRERAVRIARVVDIGSRRGPCKGTCLQRSLALWFLLRRRGVESDLRIGVRRDPEDFAAHSWVELDGFVLNDHQEIGSRFAPLDEAVR